VRLSVIPGLLSVSPIRLPPQQLTLMKELTLLPPAQQKWATRIVMADLKLGLGKETVRIRVHRNEG
jgi:hypothetical protein